MNNTIELPMMLLKQLGNTLRSEINNLRHGALPSEEAYRIWSQTYDDEDDNLMLYYDKIILSGLISKINPVKKIILDYGCGTGRNWNNLLSYNPAKLIGCDNSPEMLDKLRIKFPDSESYLVSDNNLYFLNSNEFDLIVSTLVIAHIKNIKKLFSEWNSVMNLTGDIIITDFHPEILKKGGSRSFKKGNKLITVKNYIHPIHEIEELFLSFGFKITGREEKIIDESVKDFYVRHNALTVYERFKGMPFIYGIHLSR
jgi:ubiquinone/menaquinone biosynthesis C-methylase UbiE